jgi:hypothetical protein
MIGQKFGRLTVVSTFSKDRQLWCVCSCECKETETCIKRARHLRRGVTKSCGCFRREQCSLVGKSPNHFKLPVGEAAFRNLCLRYKVDAKKRNLYFELTKDDIRKFSVGNCYYCGAAPSSEHYASPIRKNPRNSSNGTYTYNGIDRLDNTKGYSLENCVSCCSLHNFMKSDLPLDVFINACRQVSDRFQYKAAA